MYFLICVDENGVTIEGLKKDELLERLNTGYYGETVINVDLPKENHYYWKKSLLIIKGDIVIPEATKVVEKYKI